MKQPALWTACSLIGLLAVSGCGSPSSSAAAPAAPSATLSDTPSRIMSLTGKGFTICGVEGDAPPYAVTVCGDLAAGRTALEKQFPGQTTPAAYTPGDDGPHSPQELVLQWQVNHTTGRGFTIVTSLIQRDGTISVGVDGDLDHAHAVFEQRFPGRTTVHAAKPIEGGPLVVPATTP